MNGCCGHRQRLKQRFMTVGRLGMCEHELLELLLCFAIPRRDVKGIAKDLLARFGSLEMVLRADKDQLMLSDGVGENSALLLKLFQAFIEHISSAGKSKPLKFVNSREFYDYLKKYFGGRSEEELLVLMLNREYHILDSCTFAGGVRSVVLDPSELALRILSCRGVSSVVFVHNHPGKTFQASQSDIRSTIQMRNLLGSLKIILTDHLVICGDRIYSLMKGVSGKSAALNGDSSRQKPGLLNQPQ